MAYTPREIKDRVAVGDDIFIVEDLGNNRIRLIPAPTHVSEAGTPVNKALLQPMEDHMGDVANPHATTKAQVGLGNVDNVKQATKAEFDAHKTEFNAHKAEFDAHKADFANPHATTKEQVGLGLVQNYGIATQAQAEAGTANTVYMTPRRVKEAIASQVPTLPCFYKLLDSFISSGEVGINQVAGIKNSMYRGKNLGTVVTAEQWANIANGTFKDMYIGDYWTINGTTYLIAAFNYYYNTGDTNLTTNHITLVPAGSMYQHRMNPTNTTEGGYVGSEMYTTGLDQAKTKIHADFSGHVLTHSRLLCSGVTNGQASDGDWLDSDVELMNEVMAYGSVVNGKATLGLYNIGIEKSQLPLFALRPDLLDIRATWWLRDVYSAAEFALVGTRGDAHIFAASVPYGVRPVFSIS